MSGLSALAYAIVLGGVFAAGVALVATRVPRLAAPSLSRRIAPYLRDIADPRGLTPLVGAPATVRAWRDRLVASLGGATGIERRLHQAGWTTDAAGFRAQQLGAVVVAGLVGGGLTVAMALAGRTGPVAAALPLVTGALGAMLWDLRLSSAARRRKARIESELPTVLEFLALCLAAGEGLRDALARVGAIGTGDVTAELRRAVLESGTGSNLADALLDTARRLDVPTLSRAVEHLAAAIERGAPLAGVLLAQAGDAREDAKRALIEQAGRKEIGMLFPVVFLLLPLSVLFAVFPGVVMLRLGIG